MSSFDKWYETFDRDGGELLLFNTLDLKAAWDAALRHAADIAKRQYLKNKDKAPTAYHNYHNCYGHECYGCRADEAITIQTLLETEVNRKGGVR